MGAILVAATFFSWLYPVYRFHGFVAFVPDWVLVDYWDKIPSEWVLGAQNKSGSSKYVLENRISAGMLSNSHRIKLTALIVDAMTEDLVVRWDLRATTLLGTCIQQSVSGNSMVVSDARWDELPLLSDMKTVLRASTLDLVCVSRGTGTLLEKGGIQQIPGPQSSAYEACRAFLLAAGKGRGGPRSAAAFDSILQPLANELSSETFSSLILSTKIDEDTRRVAIQVLRDAGLVRTVAEYFLTTYEDEDLVEPSERHWMYGVIVAHQDPGGLAACFDAVMDWYTNGSPEHRRYATDLLHSLQDLYQLTEASRDAIYLECIRRAKIALEDAESIDEIVRFKMIDILLAHNIDGSYSLQILFNSLGEDYIVPNLPLKYLDHCVTIDFVDEWLRIFDMRSYERDSVIANWIEENMPFPCTEHQSARLDDLARKLSI